MKNKITKILFFSLFISLYLSYIQADTLNLSISSSPSRLNPILSSDSASSEIEQWVFNALFTYDKNGNIKLDLAKAYKFKTKTQLHIKLKQNVLWHDGVEFTADDVIFTYEQIKNPKNVNSILSNYNKVKEVNKIDKYTIEIIYTEPYFKALEIWMVGIIPYHILKNEKNLMTSSFNKHPIGTGAYTLKGFKAGQDIKLYAFKDYFDGKAKINEIHYKYLPDPQTTFLMLKQNKLDLASLTPLQVDRQINDKFKNDYKIIERASFSYDYLAFNLNKKKFQNIKVRQALSLAINRQELIDILFFGHGKVCTGPFLPDSSAFNDKVKPIQQNIKKAKQLLKEAGYDENNPFTFEVHTNTGGATRIYAAQILQHQLAKVSVKMKIKVMQWQAFLNTIVHPRNFESLLLGWSLPLMPDARPLWHSKSNKLGAFNLTGYKNKKVDKLIETASSTIDKEKLAKINKQIFKIITDDLAYLFLYIPNSIIAVNKNIKNIEPVFTGIMHNQKDWIKK